MTTDDGLAREFGYDITMSDGNMGLPSAVHKEYMERCTMLYKEFVTNMSLHMKEVKMMKKELRTLHEEKMRHLRFSLYRTSEGSDPFARRVEISSTPTAGLESRNNTPWGLNTIPDEDKLIRPETAPSGNQQSQHIDADRPKTAGCVLDVDHEHKHELGGDDGDDMSDSDLSQLSGLSKTTIVGVLDRKSELSSSRRIVVGQHSFNKITHGKVRAKLKHREGHFLVKPIRVDHDSEKMHSDTVAYDPLKSKNNYDPLYERLALVRKVTDFKTPTISSDMKINNRVPIQKSLRGIDAKRTTISEIYQNARDRKSRHFRIVSNTPRSKSALKSTTDRTEKTDTLVHKFIDNLRSKSAHPERTFGSRLSHVHDASRVNTPLHGTTNDEIESVTSANIPKPRPILTSTSSVKGFGDSSTGRENLNSTSSSATNDAVRRPQSRVAFVRNDSQSSANGYLQPGDSVNLSASLNSNSGIAKQFGNRLNLTPGNTDRHRTTSGSSDASAVFGRQTSTDDMSKSKSEHLPLSRTNSATVGRLGLSPRDLQSRGLDAMQRCESKLSLSSVGTAKSGAAKIKSDVNKATGTRVDYVVVNGVKQKLGFQAPSKMESRLDSVNIVRQQVKQDKQLDERMTVWRRRMAARSSVMNSKSIMFSKRGKLR